MYNQHIRNQMMAPEAAGGLVAIVLSKRLGVNVLLIFIQDY